MEPVTSLSNHDKPGLLIMVFFVTVLIILLILKWYINKQRKKDETYRKWEQEVNDSFRNSLNDE